MQIFKTHFISGVPFMSGLLCIEAVIWIILLLGEFWGPRGTYVRKPLQCPLVIVPFSALFLFKKNKCDAFTEGSLPRNK